jgi:hypothetical protein
VTFVSIEALLSIAGVVVGFAGAAWVAVRLARATRLGLAHPAIVWVAAHGVLFGIGALVLAVVDERPMAGLYVGTGAGAFALGAWSSASVARRRGAAGPAWIGADDIAPVRVAVAIALAILSVGLLVPTFLESGIPFLTTDITGARSEIAGLVVQPLRVALPTLAVALVLRARRAAPEERRQSFAVAVAGLVLVGGFELLMASRYLLAELALAVALGWLLAGGRIRWPLAIAGVVVAAVLFGSIQLARAWDLAADRPLAFLVERTVSRVVLVQPRTMDALMETIPAEEPFFMGLTWVRRLGPLLGRDDIPNIGYWIYPKVVDDPSAVGGYAAPGLIGEAWANFGWAGLLLLAGVGVAAERLGSLAASRRAGSADVVAASLAILFLARTHALGLVGLLVVLALVAAWRVLAGPDGGLRSTITRTVTWRPPA